MPANDNKDFLAMAAEADQSAQRAVSPAARRAWQAIAREYRLLAAETLIVEQRVKSPPS